MPQYETARAQELAIAAQQAGFLFWFIIVGALALIAFWSLVRWRMHRRAIRRSRETLRAETRRHEAKNPLYDEIAWREFCDRNQLPESTRIMLMATVRERR
jgi:hypothetical protein